MASSDISCYFSSPSLIFSNSFDLRAGPQWSPGGSFKIQKEKERKKNQEREIHKPTTGGDLSTPLSITETTERKKSARIEELNTIN